MKKIIIVAGDPSGDLYGSMLIRALKKRKNISVECAGGPLMKKACTANDAFRYDLASHGVTGFFAPIKKLPTFVRLKSAFRKSMSRGNVDAVVCVDFYGFNRHILSAAKKSGVPAYYFISPQIWASRPGRIRHIKKCVTRMFVIFPFEETLYKKAGVPVTWVGHPLIDVLPPPHDHSRPAGMRLGLLPGSRRTEIRRHLPLFLKSASRMIKDFPDSEVTVFGAPQIDDRFYAQWLKSWHAPSGAKARLVRETDYYERARQDFVLTSSGTATLENALLGLPMVVVYKLAWPTYWIARALIRVPYIAMANLLAGKKIVPELIQSDANPESVADAALDILGDLRQLRKIKEELLALRDNLGGPGAVERVAAHLCDSAPAARGAAA